MSLGIGTLIGIAFSQSAIVRRSFYPYAILLQTVPSVALAPLVILWFGHGFTSVVVVAFIISLFPIITNSTAGLLAVDRNLVELFQMANASRLQALWKLRLPNSIPQIITGAKIACGLSVIGAIVGEFSAGYGTDRFGLGYLITQNSTKLETDYLFAAVLAAMLLGVAIFGSVSLVGELILRLWHAPADAADRVAFRMIVQAGRSVWPHAVLATRYPRSSSRVFGQAGCSYRRAGKAFLGKAPLWRKPGARFAECELPDPSRPIVPQPNNRHRLPPLI